jgi:hypothetical protein
MARMDRHLSVKSAADMKKGPTDRPAGPSFRLLAVA